MTRRETLTAIVMSFVVLMANCRHADAAATVFGYTARADVAVPGGKTQTWVMTGVVTTETAAFAMILAQNEAAARMAAKGSVLVGPTVGLCTPLVGRTEKVEKER